MAQVKDLGSTSFILVCTKKGAGSQERNAWIASGSAESSCGHQVLLPLECTSILYRYFRSMNCNSCPQSPEQLFSGVSEESCNNDRESYLLQICMKRCRSRGKPLLFCSIAQFLAAVTPSGSCKGGFSNAQIILGHRTLVAARCALPEPSQNFCDDEALQGKCCETKHGFQSGSSSLPSPREGCSEGHAQIGTGPMKQHFCCVYRREDLLSPLHTKI